MKKTKQAITLTEARAQYPHRYTMEHVPSWALKPAPNGKFYAPQFRDDKEWFENTIFPPNHPAGEHIRECYTTRQTWPLGQWLDAPYNKETGWAQKQAAPAPDTTIDFTRITNDVNGNPRYVVHFLELVTDEEMQEFHARDGLRAISNAYAFAVQRAHKIGGRKYTAKSYGGGIVFQSYSLAELTADIKRVKGA